MESNSVCNHTSDNKIGQSDLFITSTITDRIGLHEVLLPINQKNYNFKEKKNTHKVWKGKIYIKSFNQGCDLKYNFKCDWLIELSDNKLSNNNLTSEFMENRSFLNQPQPRKL